MNGLRSYVRSTAVELLVNAMRAAGFSAADRNSAVLTLYSLLDGTFGNLVAIVLAPLVYIYNQIASLDISLPGWIYDTYDFLFNTVAYYWNWLISSVKSLNTFVTGIGNTIRSYVSIALRAYEDALGWLDWVRWRFGDLLEWFLSDPGGFIEQYIPNGIRNVIEQWRDWGHVLIDFAVRWYDRIINFLDDPLAFILGLFSHRIRSAWEVISDDLEYLTFLFGAGKRLIVDLLTNPLSVLERVADVFLDWLGDLLARKW